jgi:uncharacterized protein involved in exopolysaccharide biosynthesis
MAQQRASAQITLSESLATLGNKHPKVIEAKMRMASADKLIKEQLSKTPEDILKTAGENITFAQASAVPSSPKPLLVIGIALLVGLLMGIAIAIWRERNCLIKSGLTGDPSSLKHSIAFVSTAAHERSV